MDTKYNFMKEWNNCKKDKIFEIELNNGERELFYITYNSSNDKLYSGSGIAIKSGISVNIDYDFGLDANLANLYEKCINYLIEIGLY